MAVSDNKVRAIVGFGDPGKQSRATTQREESRLARVGMHRHEGGKGMGAGVGAAKAWCRELWAWARGWIDFVLEESL